MSCRRELDTTRVARAPWRVRRAWRAYDRACAARDAWEAAHAWALAPDRFHARVGRAVQRLERLGEWS